MTTTIIFASDDRSAVVLNGTRLNPETHVVYGLGYYADDGAHGYARAKNHTTICLWDGYPRITGEELGASNIIREVVWTPPEKKG